MNLASFIQNLNESPNNLDFEDTIAVIDALYCFTPTAFTNGDQSNDAGENSGSCKIFAFAQLQNLNKDQTLQCFGRFYRQDVLQNPNATDHQNIRNFMLHGWDGINFDGQALREK